MTRPLQSLRSDHPKIVAVVVSCVFVCMIFFSGYMFADITGYAVTGTSIHIERRVETPAGSSGSSSGGGGATGLATYSGGHILLFPNYVKLVMRPGDSMRVPVSVANFFGQTIDVMINASLPNGVMMSSESISIPRNSSQPLDVVVAVPEDAAGSSIYSIPFTVQGKGYTTLLTLVIDVVPTSSYSVLEITRKGNGDILVPGANLDFSVTIDQLVEPMLLTFNYSIVNLDNEVIFFESEFRNMTSSFGKVIALRPDMLPGSYLLKVTYAGIGSSGIGSLQFSVGLPDMEQPMPSEPVPSKHLELASLILVLAVPLVLVIVFALVIVHWKSSRSRTSDGSELGGTQSGGEQTASVLRTNDIQRQWGHDFLDEMYCKRKFPLDLIHKHCKGSGWSDKDFLDALDGIQIRQDDRVFIAGLDPQKK